MIVEQIRYYATDEDLDQVLEVRRAVGRVRGQLGLPPGQILLADPAPEDGPSLVWQCGYQDEGEMASVQAQLMGNAEYEAARERLGVLAVRVELELYTAEDEAE